MRGNAESQVKIAHHYITVLKRESQKFGEEIESTLFCDPER
ncbi:unnamed protein product [Camellia sinensis]